MNQHDHNLLNQAIQLATQSVHDNGGPFGAILVLPDGTPITGTNNVTSHNDPTAHAEITAIRNAAQHAQTHNLTGSTLYSSCQPCPMCYTAAAWARIDTLIYAATMQDATAHGFDDYPLWQAITNPTQQAPYTYHHASLPNRLDPFTAWDNKTDRIDY